MEDCIVMTLECVNLLDKKCFGNYVSIKVDNRKTFDSMSWSFILIVLHRFGFLFVSVVG